MPEVAPSAKELEEAKDKTKPGAEFNAPPPSLMKNINKHIDEAIAAMPDKDKKGTVVVSVETKSGVNAAIVQKLDKDGDWAVTAWVGKKWDSTPVEGGVYVRGSW